MAKIKVKKLDPNAKLPKFSTEGAVGADLVATSRRIVEEAGYGYVEYGTGLAFEPEDGYWLEIVPRSSLSKTGLILSNSVGVIDTDYRGEVSFRFKYIPGTAAYQVGDRIGQIIIRKHIPAEFEEVEDLTETERGSGGYGSTGR